MSFFDEFNEIFKKLREKGGSSSGYSISVTYTPDGKPIVNVETYGDVDENSLRKEIEKQYPGAEIKGLGKEPLIKEEKGEENMEKKEKHIEFKEKKRKPLIWEDDEE